MKDTDRDRCLAPGAEAGTARPGPRPDLLAAGAGTARPPTRPRARRAGTAPADPPGPTGPTALTG